MNIEEARQKKLNELKKQMEEQTETESRQEELQQQLDAAIKPLLSINARERLNNVKLVNNQLYLSVAQTILMLKQRGQIDKILEDKDLKLLLEKFSQNKREIKIKRK